MSEFDYDLIVIGSGPAGQKAAIQAANLDKKVALVEKKGVVGGICINVGTIPSKTLREAVVYLSGYRQHSIYGESYMVKNKITIEDLLVRAEHVIRNEIEVTRHQLLRERIDLFHAEASFKDAHTLKLKFKDRKDDRYLSAGKIFIGVGTNAAHDPSVDFDGRNIFTSDDILTLDEIPRTLTVVGGGVIGLEYASIFAALDVRVTVIDRRERLLSFVDAEIVDALVYQLRQKRVTFRLEETVQRVERLDDKHESVRIHTESGKQIQAEKVLYSIGRNPATKGLNLKAAGIKTDKRGRILVNDSYQTDTAHIYAAGDVIGFPSLASTSMEQGRFAACHAFGVNTCHVPERIPYGIYSIPEISLIGQTEQELTESNIPYEVGEARYHETARGHIIGDDIGLLKLIFHLETRKLLGVAIIGERASELIHIGQAVMALNGTLDYFIETVFNYPTLAECYKIAARDGLNRLPR